MITKKKSQAKAKGRRPAGPPARARATPSRTRAKKPPTGAGSVRNVNELMAYAYAMEEEAAERYTEFADAMEAHNNREVAELFRKLARIEQRHADQVLEEMGWNAPPAPPHGGYHWEGRGESPESGERDDLHYLMQPYHALQIAYHNEQRAQKFFARLIKIATAAAVRKAAVQMEEEEAEHVRLIEEWIKRTPVPATGWSLDPDPPVDSD